MNTVHLNKDILTDTARSETNTTVHSLYEDAHTRSTDTRGGHAPHVSSPYMRRRRRRRRRQSMMPSLLLFTDQLPFLELGRRRISLLSVVLCIMFYLICSYSTFSLVPCSFFSLQFPRKLR